MVNKYALSHQLQAIAKQWNIEDFHFYLSLDVSTLSLESTRYSH
jgi:hypothetical protein